jgi:Na+/H+-dicarboxylate symporter
MMKKLDLHWQVLIAIVLGILFSFASIQFDFIQFTKDWISPIGDIFIRLLKLVAIPLVLFSIIGGIAKLTDASGLGKLGLYTVAMYLFTTLVAISIGMGLTQIIKPGNKIDTEIAHKNRLNYEIWADAHQIPIVGNQNLLHDPTLTQEINRLQKEQDKDQSWIEQNLKNAHKQKNTSLLQYVVDMVPDNFFVSLTETKYMMQVIFFAILFAISLLLVERIKVQPVVDFIEGMNEVFLQMIRLVMKFAPFFVFCLMAGTFSKISTSSSELYSVFKSLGWYAATILLGFALVIFGLYPLLLRIFNPQLSIKDFFKHIKAAQFVALSTSSSAATLPVTMECVENKLGVSKRVSNFVLPIGATINMDGTSLYQGAAVIFLAQFHGIDLSWWAQLGILFTTLLASVGASGVPSAGLVLLIVILEGAGLNPQWIAIIAPIDRLLDMVRTVVNVTGDAMVAVTLNRLEKK